MSEENNAAAQAPETEVLPRPSVIIEPEGLAGSAWIAGAESGIAYKTLVDNGDWRIYQPKYEDQTRYLFDSVSCVTYSAENTLEPQLQRFMQLGQIPQAALDFLKRGDGKGNSYIDDTGKFNFSDRFSAIMDGTTVNGNYMSNAPDSFRHDGLIPEGMLPFPEDVAAQAPSIGETAAVLKYLDQSVITPEMIAIGQEFLKYFEIKYENIWYGLNGAPNLDLVRYHLKQAPLHFAASVCSGENSESVIANCGCGSGHARAIYAVDDAIEIFDSFYKANKKLALDFCIPYLYKIVITVKSDVLPPVPPKYTFTKQVVPESVRRQNPGMYPENDPNDVIALQKALQYLKSRSTGKPFLDPSIIPVANFGPLTTAASIAYQTDRKVATPGEIRIAQGQVGPKTRAALNAELAAA